MLNKNPELSGGSGTAAIAGLAPLKRSFPETDRGEKDMKKDFTESFAAPEAEYSMAPFWFLNDGLDPRELERQLEGVPAYSDMYWLGEARNIEENRERLAEQRLPECVACFDKAAACADAFAACLGAPVYRSTLPDSDIVSELHVCHLASELEVLRDGSYHRTWENTASLAHFHIIEHCGMRHDDTPVTQLHKFVYKGVWSDFHVLTYLCIRVHCR